MEISTKLRYGARALAELGRVYPERPISARELAELQGLSVKYLEHILSALKTAGIIISERGMSGGYKLARSPEQITLGAVFRALEGSTAPVKCVDNPELCNQSENCPTRPTWVELKDAVDGVLSFTTIADLSKRVQKTTQAKKPECNI